MPTAEIFNIVKQVLTSWQVIAVTIAILLYISIINYVSRSYRKPRVRKERKVKVKKEAPIAAPLSEESDDDLPGGNSNDELGLEEA